jgi:hypothetical protein
MQFQVPQFIETEDKVIGPLTLKQFLYLAAAGAISFALFFFLKTFLWIIATFILGSVGAALAFIKVQGRPLPKVLIAALSFYWKPRTYLWQRTTESAETEKLELPKTPAVQSLLEKLTTSRTPISKREKVIAPPSLENVKAKSGRYEILKKITGEREIAKRVDYR